MLKLFASFSRSFPKTYSFSNPHIRLFFNESFQLKDAWSSRLNSPILKRINVSDLFYELDHQFQHFACASSLDIDLFANAINDDTNFDELEEVVHKLRLSPEATNILPSTHHAIIRLYMDNGKIDDLLRILDDRLNYGIFPDDYCSLLLMDYLIKHGNYKDAARVSTLNMLQEDVSNPMIQYLSIFACHKYLENPVPWSQENKTDEEEDDDEEVKVRVKYIRNPFFDDHFDLVKPYHLVGKTLAFIGSEINDHIGRTYKLIGLLLQEKFNIANKLIKSVQPSNDYPFLCKDGFKLIDTIIEQQLKNEEIKDEQTKLLLSEVQSLMNSFSDSQLDTENALLSVVESRLKDLVVKNENKEIVKMNQIYQEWEMNRENLLEQQILNLNKEKELAEIKRQMESLKQKEDEIFFFDREDKLDLILEEKEKKKEELEEKRRIKKQMIFIPKKLRVSVKPPEPPLESYFDENIPMKLVKTKL